MSSVICLLIFISIFNASGSTAATAADVSDASIREFLTGHLGESPFGPSDSVNFKYAAVPDSNIFVVYMTGMQWCGSSGCTLFFLKNVDGKFSSLGSTSTVNLPIIYRGKSKNGFPEFGVRLRGGGLQREKEAVLSFDGKKYPDSPFSRTVKTGSPVDGGSIIIGENDLYYPLNK